jgi:hypothetical protein
MNEELDSETLDAIFLTAGEITARLGPIERALGLAARKPLSDEETLLLEILAKLNTLGRNVVLQRETAREEEEQKLQVNQVGYLNMEWEIGERKDSFLATTRKFNTHKEEEGKDRFEEEIESFLDESLLEMKKWIPTNIFQCNKNDFQEQSGYNTDMINRVWRKQAIWLITKGDASDDWKSIHVSDLCGRFGATANNFDIVELAAIYRASPTSLLKDPHQTKRDWRSGIKVGYYLLSLQTRLPSFSLLFFVSFVVVSFPMLIIYALALELFSYKSTIFGQLANSDFSSYTSRWTI